MKVETTTSICWGSSNMALGLIEGAVVCLLPKHLKDAKYSSTSFVSVSLFVLLCALFVFLCRIFKIISFCFACSIIPQHFLTHHLSLSLSRIYIINLFLSCCVLSYWRIQPSLFTHTNLIR